MYAIICNARSGKNQGIKILALVDRKKTRRLWWTSDHKKLILAIPDLDEANAKVASLRQNNARVVSYSEAANLIECQKRRILKAKEERAQRHTDQDCMDAVELGWDAHKNGDL